MFKIKLSDANTESWEKVQVRGGKELDVRVVAHTAVYHSYSNSILVYGGVVASVARYVSNLYICLRAISRKQTSSVSFLYSIYI